MVGFGYDVHRLEEGQSLILGGVTIPSGFGTVAHSDGDVLLHAICDALLGAAALGDIGEHFPDTDAEWKDVSSVKLLEAVTAMLQERDLAIVNIDATLALERPKILPYKAEMRAKIAAAAGLPLERVSVKATTGEKLGFVGSSAGVQAYAVCMLQAA